MQCVEKITKGFNNYEEEINRIIKEKRKKNMCLKDAYVTFKEKSNETKKGNSVEEGIVLVFLKNENKSNKKRNVAVQGKIKKYKDQYDFIRKKIEDMRSFREQRYITWAVDKCLEFDGIYLLLLSRKRKGYHRKKR